MEATEVLTRDSDWDSARWLLVDLSVNRFGGMGFHPNWG